MMYLRGSIFFVLIFFNTLFHYALFILPVYIIRRVTENAGVRTFCFDWATFFGRSWIFFNTLLIKWVAGTKIEIEGIEGLSREKSYLVISNHRSWNDVLVLQSFSRIIPFFISCIKKSLLSVPMMGHAWQVMEVPLLNRYSKEFLEKHPEYKGKDLESTRTSCEILRNYLVSLGDFVEGTRFSIEKHAKQKSPYKHLLKAKSGALAVIMSVMGDSFGSLLDITILYFPMDKTTFWDLGCGRIKKVRVEIKEREIPRHLIGGDYKDKEYRDKILEWVHEMWLEKDKDIERIMDE